MVSLSTVEGIEHILKGMLRNAVLCYSFRYVLGYDSMGNRPLTFLTVISLISVVVIVAVAVSVSLLFVLLSDQ